jgi:hypothetical protein
MAGASDLACQPEHDKSASQKERLPERQSEQHDECRKVHEWLRPLLSLRDKGSRKSAHYFGYGKKSVHCG